MPQARTTPDLIALVKRKTAACPGPCHVEGAPRARSLSHSSGTATVGLEALRRPPYPGSTPVSWPALHNVTLIMRQSIWKLPGTCSDPRPSRPQLSLQQSLLSHWPPMGLCREEEMSGLAPELASQRPWTKKTLSTTHF